MRQGITLDRLGRLGGPRRLRAQTGGRRVAPSSARRVVPPVRDARFVDLILAIFTRNSGLAPGTGLQGPDTGSQNLRTRGVMISSDQMNGRAAPSSSTSFKKTRNILSALSWAS
jgi:hypothetical protein